MNRLVLLLCIPMLASCDKLTGAADQKIADAEAIGFACRVADKQPEVCMKENDAYSPSSVLDGWKAADEDIRDGKLGGKATGDASSATKEGEAAAPAEGDKPAEGKTDAKSPDAKAEATGKGDKTTKTDMPAKPETSKETKPADTAAKH